MTRRESGLQRRIRQWLEGQGAWVFTVAGSARQRAGVPDLLVCWRGQFLALEVKRPGQGASPLQVRELREMERAGGVAAVVHSLEEVREILETMEGADANRD